MYRAVRHSLPYYLLLLLSEAILLPYSNITVKCNEYRKYLHITTPEKEVAHKVIIYYMQSIILFSHVKPT